MKKDILVVFGIADTFCSESSKRCIRKGKTGPELAKDITEGIANGNFFGYINASEPADTNEDINPFASVQDSRVIDVKLCSTSMFNINNQITIKESVEVQDRGEVVLHGDQLDYIIPPTEYNLNVVGIDINGIFVRFVNEAIAKGYNVTVFSDRIKPFGKSTVDHIMSKSKEGKLQFRKFTNA